MFVFICILLVPPKPGNVTCDNGNSSSLSISISSPFLSPESSFVISKYLVELQALTNDYNNTKNWYIDYALGIVTSNTTTVPGVTYRFTVFSTVNDVQSASYSITCTAGNMIFFSFCKPILTHTVYAICSLFVYPANNRLPIKQDFTFGHASLPRPLTSISSLTDRQKQTFQDRGVYKLGRFC